MKQPNEWPALDVAKGLCVLIMVFVHCEFALMTNADEGVDINNPVYPLLLNLVFLGLFPLAIPATAGASLRMHLDRFWSGSRVSGYEIKTILRAGAAIALLGFLMNFLAWGIGEFFQWDVLQFVGVSWLVLVLLCYLHVGAVYALGLATLVLTPWLRSVFMAHESTFTILLVGSRLRDGYWPFFPWFFTVAWGFVMADLRRRLGGRFGPALAVSGVVLLAAGSTGIEIDPGHLWGATIFQPSVRFVVGLVGFFNLWLAICGWVASRMDFSRYGLVMSFSKGILWIYLFHVSLADRVGAWLSPRLSAEWAAFVYPGVMAAACWGVGALSQFLGGKRLRVVVARAT